MESVELRDEPEVTRFLPNFSPCEELTGTSHLHTHVNVPCSQSRSGQRKPTRSLRWLAWLPACAPQLGAGAAYHTTGCEFTPCPRGWSPCERDLLPWHG